MASARSIPEAGHDDDANDGEDDVGSEGGAGLTAARAPAAPVTLARGELEKLPRANQSVYKVAVVVQDPELGRVSIHIIFVEHPAGAPKEVFLVVGRTGQLVYEVCRDLGMAWSRTLSLGLSVEALVSELVGDRGAVKGPTTHPLLKSVVSVKDLVGKLLAYEYLGRTDFIDADVLGRWRADPANPEPRCVELEQLRRFRDSQRNRRLDGFPHGGGEDDDDNGHHEAGKGTGKR